ncbi:MAG TPA: pyruvate dehydrogenase complex E1 component subunit beta [Patescibacteria group bacterium]|nr:pyruvate dehydrogenase complex E1 component subunit beta [Patescibacteria group bacterium]
MPWTKVYIDKADFENTLAKEGLRGITCREAIREAQEQMLTSDKNVFILGEGVDDAAGIFGTTLGLAQKFGTDRVLDIPVAENGMTGVAIGAAMAGMRPVFVHMRMDFLPMCMDQIINHAAKWCYMTGGKVNIPLVVRSIIGRGWGSAAQHSQALHALFAHIPGLKVVMPATPYDAKGLLVAALKDGNPVMCIEHRWTYDYIGYVPAEIYEVPIGKGLVRKAGKDVTVVALSLMVYEAMRADKTLQAEGIDIEIIDPRSIKPLDEELILDSVKKTGRLVIADVGCKTGGIAAEIIAGIAERTPEILKAPVQRVCLPDTPTPASPALEKEYYPQVQHIVDAVKQTLRTPAGGNKGSFPQDKFDVSVVMPALNEQENIQVAIVNTLKAMADCNIRGEIVAVNDGSTDKTEELIKEISQGDGRVRFIRHEKPKGIGSSFWDGVDVARGDVIVMLPGDNENDPWEIFRYFKLLEHVDIIIPFIFNRQVRSVFRNALSFVYRFIINSTFAVNFNYTNGTVLYRKSVLKELPYRSCGFFFQTDILVRTVKKGYLFSEVPYRLGLRKSGVSKAVSFPSLLQVIKGYLRLVRDYYFHKHEKTRTFTSDSVSAKRYRT